MKSRTILLVILASIIAAFLVVWLTGCARSGGDPTPTPPPLKPLHLTWDANPASQDVLYYNIYIQTAATTYSYVASVYVPAPLDYTLPVGAAPGTLYTVTASNGSLESDYATPVAVPAKPATVGNLKIGVGP